MNEKNAYLSFPPWQASFGVGALLALGLHLPQDLDDIATVATFCHRIFPEWVSLPALAIIRLGIACIIWGVAIYIIFFDKWTIDTTYRNNSKLQNTSIQMYGFRTLFPFTSWCWIMLGMKFSLSGYITLLACMGRQNQIPQWVLRMALILWELSGPFALLVSAVVRYAIWPVVLASGKKHKLACFRNQMQHNMNSVYVLTEMVLLGGLPLKVTHLSLPCLVGSIYILFTWFNCYSYADKQFGPQYIYWFMDPTLGKASFIALASLVVVLVVSFLAFYFIEMIMEYAGKSLPAHIIFVILVANAVIKTN